MESLVEFFIDIFGGVNKDIVIFIISLMPILELRGGLLAASLLDIEFVIKFGEWIRQNGHDAVEFFYYLSSFAFAIILIGCIFYKNISEEEEEEDEQDNDVSDKDGR